MPRTLATPARVRSGISTGFADRIDWEQELRKAAKRGGVPSSVVYVTHSRRRSKLRGYDRMIVFTERDEGITPGEPQALRYTLDWLAPIARTLHDFRKLGENWDSYGGSPINPANMAAALAFLWGIIDSGVRVPHPSVQPSSDGGVGLSWLSSDTEIEISFESDEDSGIVVTQGGRTWDAPISEAAGILTSLADRL